MRLPQLLGNDALKAALAQLPPSGLGSAVLLDGPEGIGKKTAANDLAQALLCRDPNNAPCGVCPACRRVLAGSHPDLFRLEEPEAGKGIKLEQVREMRAQSFIRPSEAPYKVFLIPQADKLNAPSQNALLKILEEPANSIFLLLCENREAMLQTVRSRCKTFRLTPLPRDLLLAALRQRCPSASDAQRTQAAEQCAGILGRALDALSGQEKPALTAARNFCFALQKGELAIYTACQEAQKLSREEYGDFCDECCRLLTSAVAKTGSGRYLTIFEYLEKQRAMLLQNPSVTSLTLALSAFCGGLC